MQELATAFTICQFRLDTELCAEWINAQIREFLGAPHMDILLP
jgi:hypothetical protein